MVVHGQLVEPAVCLSDLYDGGGGGRVERAREKQEGLKALNRSPE